eukprot:6586020-Prorocentrum_lima.AAC.1
MTSSLVGSEMCIRDRRLGMLRRRLMVIGISPLNLDGEELSQDSSSMGFTCLLYTSDAADDM